jgi:GNAT superfamily N-acetyltransferase
MEDQGSRSFVHRSTGQVVTEERVEPGDEYVPAPRWKPADGFHLMEGFVTTVPNRYYREQLRDALSSGRGVFRNFKNALKQSHDLECSWYRFKEREMRRKVAEWYNQEREAAGLERLGPEPEETEDLTISDFVVDTALPHQLAGASYVDHEALLELGQVPASELAACVKQRLRALDAPGSHVVVARTPEDEVVGLAWARECEPAPAREPGAPTGEWELVQLAVLSSFRGVGLAGRLLAALGQVARDHDVAALRVELDAATMGARELLQRAGYSVDAVRLKFPLRP